MEGPSHLLAGELTCWSWGTTGDRPVMVVVGSEGCARTWRDLRSHDPDQHPRGGTGDFLSRSTCQPKCKQNQGFFPPSPPPHPHFMEVAVLSVLW